ncbi:MAG TPA: hypothetical protein VIO94_04275 [Phenylobacterium sp.]
MSQGVWFQYRIGPRRFKAWPVNGAGWSALLAIVLIPVLATIPLVWMVVRQPELAFLIAAFWADAMPAIFLALVLVIRAKGQKV